jgi:hypothetical protein
LGGGGDAEEERKKERKKVRVVLRGGEMAGSQETGTSLMDLITADPAPPGNPAFPPLGVNPTPDRTKPTPPRKSTSQPPTTDLLVSIKAPTPTKSSLAPLKQKRKVGIIIPNPLNDHLPFPIMFLNSLSLSLFWEVFFTSSEGFAELHSWKNGFGVFSLDSIHVKNTDLEEALVVLQTLNAPSGGYALIVRQIWHKRKV